MTMRGDRSGATAVLFTLVLPCLIGAAAFALDMGHLYVQRRQLQAATDAAALAAAARPAEAASIVRKVLDANGRGDARFTLVFGTYSDAAGAERGARFAPDPAGRSVRVETSIPSTLHFARIFDIAAPAIGARADATVRPIVSLSAGSRLASVQPALVADITKPLLGVDLGLTVLDYNGLARARVDVERLLEAAVSADAVSQSRSTPAEAFGRPVRIGGLLLALSRTLDRSGDPVAASVLRKASLKLGPTSKTVILSDSLRVDGMEPGSAAALGLGADVSVLAVLNALTGSTAFGTTTQISLAIPGLAAVEGEFQIGESLMGGRPVAVATHGAMVETGQLRLRLRLRTAAALAGLGLKLELPIELVVAGGSASVVGTICSADPAAREVRVAVRPGIAKLALGAQSGPLSSASVHATPAMADLVSAGLVSVRARSVVALTRADEVILTFRGAEIGNGTMKTARTTGLVGSLAASLLGKAEIEVRVFALGLSVSSLLGGVSDILAGVVRPLDDLIDALLASVGIGVGEMDVRVDDLQCGRTRIVG